MGSFLTIVLGAVGSLLAAEVYSWLPRFAEALVRYHASKLPEQLRERMSEEWLGIVQAQLGNFAKFIIAVDLFRAQWRLVKRTRAGETTATQDLSSADLKSPIYSYI